MYINKWWYNVIYRYILYDFFNFIIKETITLRHSEPSFPKSQLSVFRCPYFKTAKLKALHLAAMAI